MWKWLQFRGPLRSASARCGGRGADAVRMSPKTASDQTKSRSKLLKLFDTVVCELYVFTHFLIFHFRNAYSYLHYFYFCNLLCTVQISNPFGGKSYFDALDTWRSIGRCLLWLHKRSWSASLCSFPRVRETVIKARFSLWPHYAWPLTNEICPFIGPASLPHNCMF